MNTIDIIFTLMFCKMLYLFFSLSRYHMSRDFSDLVVKFLTRVRGGRGNEAHQQEVAPTLARPSICRTRLMLARSTRSLAPSTNM